MKKITYILVVCAMILPSLSYADMASTTIMSAPAPITIQPACVAFSGYVSRGALGADVVTLQNFLINAGYLNATATGYFGQLTFAAVTKFQSEHGLPTTGYVGPMTEAAISNLGCGSTSHDPIPTSGPVTINEPQAGEVWMRGVNRQIVWSAFMPQTFAAGPLPLNPASYDVYLVPAFPQCKTGMPCPMLATIKPYTINLSLSSHGNYRMTYAWVAGTTPEPGRTIPAGSYHIRVCVTGSSGSCTDSAAFTLSDTASTSPLTY